MNSRSQCVATQPRVGARGRNEICSAAVPSGTYCSKRKATRATGKQRAVRRTAIIANGEALWCDSALYRAVVHPKAVAFGGERKPLAELVSQRTDDADGFWGSLITILPLVEVQALTNVMKKAENGRMPALRNSVDVDLACRYLDIEGLLPGGLTASMAFYDPETGTVAEHEGLLRGRSGLLRIEALEGSRWLPYHKLKKGGRTLEGLAKQAEADAVVAAELVSGQEASSSSPAAEASGGQRVGEQQEIAVSSNEASSSSSAGLWNPASTDEADDESVYSDGSESVEETDSTWEVESEAPEDAVQAVLQVERPRQEQPRESRERSSVGGSTQPSRRSGMGWNPNHAFVSQPHPLFFGKEPREALSHIRYVSGKTPPPPAVGRVFWRGSRGDGFLATASEREWRFSFWDSLRLAAVQSQGGSAIELFEMDDELVGQEIRPGVLVYSKVEKDHMLDPRRYATGSWKHSQVEAVVSGEVTYLLEKLGTVHDGSYEISRLVLANTARTPSFWGERGVVTSVRVKEVPVVLDRLALSAVPNDRARISLETFIAKMVLPAEVQGVMGMIASEAKGEKDTTAHSMLAAAQQLAYCHRAGAAHAGKTRLNFSTR